MRVESRHKSAVSRRIPFSCCPASPLPPPPMLYRSRSKRLMLRSQHVSGLVLCVIYYSAITRGKTSILVTHPIRHAGEYITHCPRLEVLGIDAPASYLKSTQVYTVPVPHMRPTG
jgi:hypothetical protein